MAKASAFDKKKKKKAPSRFSRFRRAFLKATLGGVLAFGAYQYYTPEPVKESVEYGARELFNIRTARADIPPAEVKFSFEGASQPNILGKAAESTFSPNSTVLVINEWYAASGRHAQLLSSPGNAAAFNRWLSQLDHLFGASVAEKAAAVDALVDEQISYLLDPDNYGKGEYWASPIETLSRSKGDCEDFAILKYHALRYLGVPAERMFILAVGDKDGDGLNHAVLLVDVYGFNGIPELWDRVRSRAFGESVPNNFVILNNDGNGNLVENGQEKYRPYYAMNEKGVWFIPYPLQEPSPQEQTPQLLSLQPLSLQPPRQP